MTVRVEPFSPRDVEALLELIEEMNAYYGEEADSPDVRRRNVEDAVTGDPPLARLLLAWRDDAAVGFASFSSLWPALGTTHSLYVKELFVREAHRGSGVGRALMQRLTVIAGETGCSRLEWTTDTSNGQARRFYEGLGTRPLASKLFYRLDILPAADAGGDAGGSTQGGSDM